MTDEEKKDERRRDERGGNTMDMRKIAARYPGCGMDAPLSALRTAVELEDVIDELAGQFEYGQLILSTSPVDFFSRVINELTELRSSHYRMHSAILAVLDRHAGVCKDALPCRTMCDKDGCTFCGLERSIRRKEVHDETV